MKLNKIYNEDCLEGMKKLEDNSIDLVVTDPPYGIEYRTFRSNSRKIKKDHNLSWEDEYAYQSSRVLKHSNHIYCFVDAETSADFITAFKKHVCKIRNLSTIPIGIKGNGGDRIFQQQFEFCIFATLGSKDEGRKFNQTEILKPSDTYLKDKRYKPKKWLYRLPDNWHWTKASVHNAKEKLHPTEKNVSCIEDMLALSSSVNEVVLDPFMGSGTTAIACINTNRNYIGFELDEGYYKTSIERINNHVKDKQIDLF